MPDPVVLLQASTPRPCRPTPRRACCVRGHPLLPPPSSTGGVTCLLPSSLSSCCSWHSWLPPSGPFSRHSSWHCWSQVSRCSRRPDEAEEVTGGEGGSATAPLTPECITHSLAETFPREAPVDTPDTLLYTPSTRLSTLHGAPRLEAHMCQPQVTHVRGITHTCGAPGAPKS